MIKSVATPKNEINLMKITEELLRTLEILSSEKPSKDRSRYGEFEEQIINNNVRLEKRVDEVAYLFIIAREQIQAFSENGAIVSICFQIVNHLAKMLDLNKGTFQKDDWYYKYSYVLISELTEFKNVL